MNLHPQIAKKYGLKPEVDSNIEVFSPSIDLLLRITNSLSPEIGEVSQSRLWLLHSFSELISQRMLDANTGYGFCFKEHTAIDYFDWVDVTKVNLISFDKYSTRVLLAYLFFVLKEAPTIVQKSPCLIHLLLPRELRESEVIHIKIISDLSNYTISIIHKEIVLELI
ncbi:hypothetical protein [Lonsdalea britannica]|uniref:hypothetical protein n=1 Tax=Lonsdalea britannica TaxID=1082704 RepID=UPI0020CB3DC1|nr:hypothetical protein [Lonsdalea britannica]